MPPKYMPGEKRKRTLVTVEMDGIDAAIFAPEKAGQHRKTDVADTIIEQDYIVSTRRFDGRWSHKVIIDGLEVVLPHRVYQAMKRQVEAIIKEERSERGKSQADKRKAQLADTAAKDQAEASEELDQDETWKVLNS